MLWQRVLTAIPLAALVLWVILFQPTAGFDYLLYAVALIAAYEWARLSGLYPAALCGLYALGVLIVCVALIQVYLVLTPPLLLAGVIWWGWVCLRLFSLQPAAQRRLRWGRALLGLLVIPVAVLAMHDIHQNRGAPWLLYGLMLVWVADIGAYFSGRRFGRRKLAPHISPGKTVEGLLGGLLATSLYTLAAAWYFDLGGVQSLGLLLLSVLLTLVSVAGDLYESVLKREHGVKDSGRILPGHGGMLDRIDSVLAAMPVFALGLGAVLEGRLQ